MTIEEQAALYEAGVKTYMEGTSMDKDHLSRVLAQGTRDHMALEDLYEEQAARRMDFGGKDDLEYFPTNPVGSFDLETMIRDYATQDAEWSMRIFENWTREDRFAVQRPLIHNGRKMRKNGN